jgi:hypothetical protein
MITKHLLDSQDAITMAKRARWLRPPGGATNTAALSRLIDAAYADIKVASKTASSEKRLGRPTRI